MSANIEETIRNYALQNAVFFKGKANPKAIVGKILGEFPEYRAKAAEITPLINSIVEEVNAMGLDAQKAALEASDPSLLAKKEKKERTYEGLHTQRRVRQEVRREAHLQVRGHQPREDRCRRLHNDP